MQIFIEIATPRFAKTFSVDVEPMEKVDSLKTKIHSRQGPIARPHRQRLDFAGRPLDDGGSLYQYNIVNGSVIYLLLKHEERRCHVLPELRFLTWNYNLNKTICRRCYAQLPPDATHCRKKQCHSNDVRPKKTIFPREYSKKLVRQHCLTNMRITDKHG